MLPPLRSISRHFCPSLLVPLCITVSHSSPRPRSMAGSTGQSLNLLTPLAVPKAMDLFRLRMARELDLFGTLVRGKYRRSARLIRKGGAFTRSGFLGSCTTSMTYATASRMSCRRFVRNMRSCRPERPLTVETMNSNKVKMGSFRRFLTTSHSTKYLLFVLIGSWVWLWAALDYPPVLTYFGYSLVALVFLWTRPFSALRSVVEQNGSKRPVVEQNGSKRRKDQGQEKRGFLIT